MNIKNLTARNYILALIILIMLLFLPISVLAEVGDKSSTKLPGAGGLGLIILIWCYFRRNKPIGGWLLYYIFGVFAGFFMWLLLSIPNISYYNPTLWNRTGLYLAYLLSTFPQDIFTLAEFVLVFGLIIKSLRSWHVIKWLRIVLGLSVIFYIIAIFIDWKFFKPDAIIFEVFGLIVSSIWFFYFLKSKRVKSIYLDKDFETKFGKVVKIGKTPIYEKEIFTGKELKNLVEERQQEKGHIDVDAIKQPVSETKFKNREEYETWKAQKIKENEERKKEEKIIKQKWKIFSYIKMLLFSFFNGIKHKIAQVSSENINVYQRTVLILGAIILVIALWTTPQYFKGGIKYNPSNTYHQERIQKGALLKRDMSSILIRSISILGVILLVFFALRDIQKKKAK